MFSRVSTIPKQLETGGGGGGGERERGNTDDLFI